MYNSIVYGLEEVGWKIAAYLTIDGFLYGVLVTGLISNVIDVLSLIWFLKAHEKAHETLFAQKLLTI
jgi:hypothetical protein